MIVLHDYILSKAFLRGLVLYLSLWLRSAANCFLLFPPRVFSFLNACTSSALNPANEWSGS